jgi:hypothetical protein
MDWFALLPLKKMYNINQYYTTMNYDQCLVLKAKGCSEAQNNHEVLHANLEKWFGLYLGDAEVED